MMWQPAQTVILVPTYNEAENVGLIVKTIFDVHSSFHVVVLDDNSPDGTARVVQAKQHDYSTLELMVRNDNHGFAQSYLDGFKRVLQAGVYDVIVMMDADFSHDPREIPAMLDMIVGGADAVVGSRYAKARNFAGIPLWRRLLSWFANAYVRFVLRLPIADCTSGFIALRTDVLRRLELSTIRTEGYGFLFELKYQIYQQGFVLREHSVAWPDRHLEDSKMSLRRVFESARLPWLIRFRRR